MVPERRREVRHRVHRPAYASIGEGMPLVILDANEWGLALESCSPLPVSTRVTIKLGSVQGAGCIGIAARVAWTDYRSRSGIEFLNPSAGSRERLRDWVNVNAEMRANRTESARRVKSAHQGAAIEAIDGDALFGPAAERAVLLTRAHGAAVAINTGRGLSCLAAAGEIATTVGSRIDAQSGLTGACLQLGRVLHCDNADFDPRVNRESCWNLQISSIIAAPIVCGGSVVGVVEVFSRHPHAFDKSDCYALEKLAETIGKSAGMPALLGPYLDEVFSETAKTPEAAFHAAEAEQPQSATQVDAAQPMFSLEAPAISARDESSQLAIPQSPPGYEFSLTAKLTLHKRAAVWSVALIVVAFGLWLSFGNSSQWRSNSPPAANLQSWGHAQAFLTPRITEGTSTSVSSMTHDSFEELRQRAQSGNADAQLELAATYANRKGNSQNYPEAVKWLTKSAEQGNVTAATSLGAFYWAGRGVTQGYVDAYMWSAIAKAEGDEASSYRVTILQSRMSRDELAEAKRRTAEWLRIHTKQVFHRDAPAYH